MEPNELQKEVITILEEQLKKRQEINPKYSLRSFASKLGISSGALSEIMRGKRAISEKLALKLAEGLDLEGGERERFLAPFRIIRKQKEGLPKVDLKKEEVALFSSMKYFEVLAAFNLKCFNGKLDSIEDFIDADREELEEMLATLQKLDLIRFNQETGSYYRINKSVRTSKDTGPKDYAHLIYQSTERCLTATQLGFKREYSEMASRVLAIDPSKLEQARPIIKKFMDDMAIFLGDGDLEDIFLVNLNIIPMSHVERYLDQEE